MLCKYILVCHYGSLLKNNLVSPHKSSPLKTRPPPPQKKSFGNLLSFFSYELFFSELNSSFKKIYPLLKVLGEGGGEESGGVWPEIKDGRKKLFLTWYKSFLFSTRPSQKNEHLGPTKIIHLKLVSLVKRTSSAWRLHTTRGFPMFYRSTKRDQ